MTQVRNVAVIVGSLRKDSVSRKLAKAFGGLTPNLKFNIVEIGDLPHFDQDLESDPPAQWVRFREEIARPMPRLAPVTSATGAAGVEAAFKTAPWQRP